MVYDDLLKFIRFIEIESDSYGIPEHKTYQHVFNGKVLLIFREKELLFFDASTEIEIMRFPLLEGGINEETLTRRIEFYWSHDHDPCCKNCNVDNWPEQVICLNREGKLCLRKLITDFLLTEPVTFNEDRDFQAYRDLIYNHPAFDALQKKYLYHNYLKNYLKADKGQKPNINSLHEMVTSASRWLEVCTSDDEKRKKLFLSEGSVFDPIETEANSIFFHQTTNKKRNINKSSKIHSYLIPSRRVEGESEINAINHSRNEILNIGKKWFISRRYLWCQSLQLTLMRLLNRQTYTVVEYPFISLGPRLFAAICVGYMPIILTSDVYGVTFTFIDRIHGSVGFSFPRSILNIYLWLAGLFLTFLSFCYFCIEIKNYVKKLSTCQIIRRSLYSTAAGITYSALLGIIFVNLFTRIMIPQMQGRPLESYNIVSNEVKDSNISSTHLCGDVQGALAMQNTNCVEMLNAAIKRPDMIERVKTKKNQEVGKFMRQKMKNTLPDDDKELAALLERTPDEGHFENLDSNDQYSVIKRNRLYLERFYPEDLDKQKYKTEEYRYDFKKLKILTIILWAPAALLIGLLVQILWEDKPITEKL